MMSFKFNSKVIAVAVFFASINMSASSVRANHSQSLLSNDRSLGVTLLSREENSNYDDAAVAPDSAADAAADAAAANEDSFYAPTQQEIEFQKNFEGQLAGGPPGLSAMVEIIAKKKQDAINKMVDDFKEKNPGATIEQVNNNTSEVFKALNEFTVQLDEVKVRLFPERGHSIANDSYKQVMKFAYDYFKERPDEVNQAAKEIYLAFPDLAIPEGSSAEDAQKQYDNFIKARQEYFKTLE